MVTAEVSTPGGVTAAQDDALALMEGVAKGGYPVDITAQSTMDLTSIGSSEMGCACALIESGLEPAAVAQLQEAGFNVFVTQESLSSDQDFSPCITEVIKPMEMAELVDILPTLSLFEEETPSGQPTSIVMNVLESFGLGIDENNTLIDLASSTLITGAGCIPHPNLQSSSSDVSLEHSEDTTSASHDITSSVGDVSWDTHEQQTVSVGVGFLPRSRVEWDGPSNSSS